MAVNVSKREFEIGSVKYDFNKNLIKIEVAISISREPLVFYFLRRDLKRLFRGEKISLYESRLDILIGQDHRFRK